MINVGRYEVIWYVCLSVLFDEVSANHVNRFRLMKIRSQNHKIFIRKNKLLYIEEKYKTEKKQPSYRTIDNVIHRRTPARAARKHPRADMRAAASWTKPNVYRACTAAKTMAVPIPH